MPVSDGVFAPPPADGLDGDDLTDRMGVSNRCCGLSSFLRPGGVGVLSAAGVTPLLCRIVSKMPKKVSAMASCPCGNSCCAIFMMASTLCRVNRFAGS